MSPYFSIIIPTYNRGNLIGKTVEQVLKQTFLNFEIIIIDDGSTDNTKSVINSIAVQDDRIQYHYQENKERGAARNSGIRKSKGKFFLFFDSDDYMHPNHLTVLKEAIDNNPGIHLFASKFQMNKRGGDFYTVLNKFSEKTYDYKIFLKGNFLACLICVERNISDLNLHPEERDLAIMEDWIFNLSNTKKHPIYIIDQVTITVLEHEARSMGNNKLVIKRRLNALNHLINTLNLTAREIRVLEGYSYYFCAIHAYLDNDRTNCLRYTMKSWSGGPFIKSLIVWVKSLIGRKIIQAVFRR